MSTRNDRVRSDSVLLGAVILLIALVFAGGGFLWLRMSAPEGVRKPETPEQQPLAQQTAPSEPLNVTLVYPFDGMLATGAAPVKRRTDTQSQALETLNALFADQRAAQAAVLRDITVKTLYIDAAGTAYIALAALQQKNVRASAWEEHLAILAMVDTLTGNFEEIRQVRLLLDGREAQTLAGHIDLTRPFTKRMDLVRQ